MSERIVKTVVAILCGALLAGCQSTSTRSRDSVKQEQQARRAAAAATNVQLAAGYLEQGQHEVALEKIQRAVAIDPKNAMAHTVAGVVYDTLGDMEQAGRHYQRAVQLDQSNGEVRNNYGQFLCKSGKVSEGLEQLNKATEDPFYKTPWVAMTNAGDCEERRNDAAAAERYYRRALETRETYPDALYRLARLNLEQGEAFRARAFLQRFESGSQPTPESLRLGIRIETALENDEAVKAYENQLSRLYPHSRER